mmetsp:Transcript_29823/g.65023  ORF Transcript_29823/g.65023 Transcript_29823/m.65023 type:complete len:357 (-) Transcript_29823:85-1155(-)
MAPCTNSLAWLTLVSVTCANGRQLHTASRQVPIDLSSRAESGLLDGSATWQFNNSAACEAKPERSTRTMLRVIVPNNHGSTAMEAVLMSSKRLGTLCSSDVWQCEGHKLLEKLGHGSASEETDPTLLLETYSQYWDLKKSVFLDKKTKWMSLAAEEDQPLMTAPLPKAMINAGISDLQTAYIIMYKPVCLWPQSHFVVDHVQQDPYTHAHRELDELEEQAELHRHLVSVGRPTLVINYADLVWNPDFTQKRLEAFLPCLAPFDLDFVPELGSDVFPGNLMKISTGVRSYGEQTDPMECCNFKLGEPRTENRGKCLRDDDRPNDEADFLGGLQLFLEPEAQRRLRTATLYLDRLSDY